MSQNVVIAGGGIGGLAAALACGRAGCHVELFERAAAFAEVGAGIQIGPNVTRILHAWGLADTLATVAAFPDCLQVRDAMSGRELGVLPLGKTAVQRYGAPYATLHRADLHQLLHAAVRQQTSAILSLDNAVTGFVQTPGRVEIQTRDGRAFGRDMLLGADGLWSVVREGLLADGPPRVTGHLAYRAMVSQAALPAHLRSQRITVWLGRRLHVVQYPVRGGEWLNLVGIVQADADPSPQAVATPAGAGASDAADWGRHTSASRLRTALAGTCTPLQDLVGAMEEWHRWVLCDRPTVRRANQLARGRVALLGDAAHPMRPYLAQGAGMAIEDAGALGRVLADSPLDIDAALRAYADTRWQRNARVQARAERNGEIFHARGLMRAGRNLVMGLLGERLLDLPWLYRG